MQHANPLGACGQDGHPHPPHLERVGLDESPVRDAGSTGQCEPAGERADHLGPRLGLVGVGVGVGSTVGTGSGPLLT